MAAEAARAIKAALEQHFRSREEAEHIRRVLALNLRSCYENGPQAGPLALVEQDCIIKTTDVRGTQRDYLKALHANIKAQRAYDDAVNQNQIPKDGGSRGSKAVDDAAARLQDHVTTIKLRRTQERLQTIEKYLHILAQKPAADPRYMQSEAIFRDAPSLPEVPKTVISGFSIDKDSTKTDLKSLVDRLEKAVLRSKLLLKKEEQLLQTVGSRSSASPGRLSNASRLAALTTTRNELIAWMEAELGKASGSDEDQEAANADVQSSGNLDQAQTDEKLVQIKKRYANYVDSRRNLIQLLVQRPQPTTKLPVELPSRQHSNDSLPIPGSHLVIPYVQRLLSMTHEQKASILQKAHLNNVLTKHSESTDRALGRLAEESQLLPEHGTGRRHGFGHGSAGAASLEISCRMQPWVDAADSAKLATLENVAEKIEQGQVALEGSTAYLSEIDQLLGRTTMQRDMDTDGDSTMDDIWLAEFKNSNMSAGTSTGINQDRKDVWSALNGGLGLINAEDSPHKEIIPYLKDT
ncbi:hypothetical protein BD289DRAFT_484041 [Coniella lustricola]|uniref:Uncharacterized protein n=1 Tax=Coniella lustricola TaxID=2025994 RepID=A0A2T3A3G9_9PEZI|nr:hypothetical protein BD289DRAFT_484041 [Coniella lustricola]